MLLEAGSDSLPLYSIVLEQIEVDEKEEMDMMQNLISKLSEEQKIELLQSARKKYDELQENNLHGSIKNMREVIQYLFKEDISKIQIEKYNESDKELLWYHVERIKKLEENMNIGIGDKIIKKYRTKYRWISTYKVI